MKLNAILISLFFIVPGAAQNNFSVIIRDAASGETIPGATAAISGTSFGTSTDLNGYAELKNIPAGRHVFIFSFIGYESRKDTINIPYTGPQPYEVKLHPLVQEEVIIEGTRSNRSIESIPTRVEVLTEEIDEAATMDPSKIAHLLTHSTGIQVQQTSATSNTANVRIQGLDGRYAQILKDGFPLYGGFSGSLSIMQIPPLDLRQVEYIKGSASTLYGGGAISGVINLVSKEPVPEENLFHINASHIGAFDVNVFASRRINKIGLTILAQRNAHRYFDADKDGFTDLPELTKYNFNPKLFFFINERTKLTAGATFTTETRTGGDIFLLKNNNPWYLHYYRERNDVNRITTQLKFDHRFSETNSIAVRNSYNYFYRKLALSYAPFEPEYLFGGHQYSSFSEIAFTNRKTTAVFVTGLNFYIDEFHETRYTTWFRRDEKIWTAGAFAQYTRDLGKKVAIEAGLRADYVLDDKLFVLPRLFTLFKWTDKLTSRIGGGLGYRNPTIFNQESELHGYRNILPITIRPVEAEESYGASADVGFKTPLGKNVFLHINQMFFFTHLKNPLVPVSSPTVYNAIEFMNANGNTISQGLETFFKLGFYDFVLFAGYTFTNVTNTFSGVSQEFTLTPKHSLKGDLLYALPGKWRIGADYEYKSSQLLSNGTRTPEYWTFGFVCERTIRNFVLFGNVENFTNVRQTNFDSLVSAPFGTPQYTEVWSPLDGIVFNAGIKVRL